MGGTFQLQFRFHGDLPLFVRPKRGAPQVLRQLSEETSVKDAIEACGVPHPEIDLILVNERPVNFGFRLQSDATIEVYPVPGPAELFPGVHLQPREHDKFVADGHLGKLARNLRLLGVDVAYAALASDAELVTLSAADDRALLTRDRRLLMHAAVRVGYYPRSQNAEDQTGEVVHRFGLRQRAVPWTQCLRCNGLLIPASKEEVWSELEPLTRTYYQRFHRCSSCGRIYWEGSHSSKLLRRVERLLK